MPKLFDLGEPISYYCTNCECVFDVMVDDGVPAPDVCPNCYHEVDAQAASELSEAEAESRHEANLEANAEAGKEIDE